MTDGNTPTWAERFWKKVDRSGECWTWRAAIMGTGYGAFRVEGGTRLAHRLAYELAKGPIPVGLELDHRCRNRACVNPAHLEAVEHSENVRRGTAAEFHRSKVACPRGHAYTPENTNTRAGYRACRTCHRERGEARNRLVRGPLRGHRNLRKTHCPKGHPYSTDNTLITKAGWRRCKACQSALHRRWRERRSE